MEFRKIKQFINGGDYAVDIPWNYLRSWLKSHTEHGQTVELDPDFQRAHVWNNEKRSAFVEYVLQGGVSSRDIWWNCKGWPSSSNSIQLVDGKQRMEAVLRFLDNKLEVFNGYKLKDYTDRFDVMISFRMHVNNLETRAEVLQWYLQMNAGGVVHSKKALDKVRRMLESEK